MDIEPTGLLPAAASAVTGAIRRAAELTGASFQYLLATAKVESKLNPQAAAPTSTARGPFQFVEQTWLATLKEQGPALGYGRYADAIVRTPAGRYEITDPALVDPIMNLRSDPAASATLAGAFTNSNAAKLTAWTGRAPTEGELYLAHFMGPAGAAKLIGYVDALPQTSAAQIFPAAAAANPSVFYGHNKQPRSVAEVYRTLVARYDVARASGVPTLPTANVSQPPNPSAPPAPVTPVALTTRAAPTATVMPIAEVPIVPPRSTARTTLQPSTFTPPDTPAPAAQVAQAYANVGRIAPGKGETLPVFHSLFLAVERPKPVSPTVSALWGAPTASVNAPPTPTPQPAAPAAVSPMPPERPAGTIGLFQDQPPDAKALFRGGA